MHRWTPFAVFALLAVFGCASPDEPPTRTDAPPPDLAETTSSAASSWTGSYTYETETTAYLLALGESEANDPVGTLEIRHDGQDVIVYDVRGEAAGDRLGVVLTAHRNYEGEELALGATLFTFEKDTPSGADGLVTRWNALPSPSNAPLTFARVGAE